MRIINQFEKKLNKKLEALSYNDFLDILKNDNYKEFFSNTRDTLEIITTLIERNPNKDFIKELYTLKFQTEMLEDENIINSLFTKARNKEITKEKLEETLKNFRTSIDPLFVVSVFLCSLVEGSNLKDEETKLIEAIKNIEMNIFSQISDYETSYQLRCSIIDLIYTVREYWWNVYETDILEGINWVDNETDALINFKNQKLGNEIKSLNIKPEQMGFIDITKLKHVKE